MLLLKIGQGFELDIMDFGQFYCRMGTHEVFCSAQDREWSYDRKVGA